MMMVGRDKNLNQTAVFSPLILIVSAKTHSIFLGFWITMSVSIRPQNSQKSINLSLPEIFNFFPFCLIERNYTMEKGSQAYLQSAAMVAASAAAADLQKKNIIFFPPIQENV